MKAPAIPRVLVELGRAVEVDGEQWQYTWHTRDNWIVAANEAGTKLFLFKRPDRSKESIKKPRGEELYRRFTRRDPTDRLEGQINEPKKLVGRAHHVVYKSDKFGPCRDYIHTFDTKPQVWVDKPSKPSVVALVGKIKVTRRGIEG